MKVVLTREPPRNDTLRKILELAIEVVEIPATETRYLRPDTVVATCRVEPRTVIVTSARAVDSAVALIEATAPETVIAVGATTASQLLGRGVQHVLTASDEGARAVGELTFAGPVVTVGAEVTRPELGQLLTERGLEFQHLGAYVTQARSISVDEVQSFDDADFVVVAAPSAWSVIGTHVAPRTRVIVRGQTTFEAVRSTHENVTVAPSDTETVAVILSSLFDT